jgi:hypothetical protein
MTGFLINVFQFFFGLLLLFVAIMRRRNWTTIPRREWLAIGRCWCCPCLRCVLRPIALLMRIDPEHRCPKQPFLHEAGNLRRAAGGGISRAAAAAALIIR